MLITTAAFYNCCLVKENNLFAETLFYKTFHTTIDKFASTKKLLKRKATLL